MSEQYVIELWIPGEERVVAGPYRTLEKAMARREFLEERALTEDIDIETSIVALENGHSAAAHLFRRVREVAGAGTT